MVVGKNQLAAIKIFAGSFDNAKLIYKALFYREHCFVTNVANTVNICVSNG